MKFGGGGVYHATQHIYALKKKKKEIPPYEGCFLVAAGFFFIIFLKIYFTKGYLFV